MRTLGEQLAFDVGQFEKLGHPDLLKRFVVRNGKPFTPRSRIGRKRRAQECFKNATDYVSQHGGTYVEGFAMSNKIGFPFHHAWVTLDGESAMDPTLDAMEYQYFGVEFKENVLIRETLNSGLYGLLCTEMMINYKLMFELDPELKGVCESIIGRELT